MDLQLDAHHVLITGGSKGIGLACAQGFLREGARVSLVSRDPVNLTNELTAQSWHDAMDSKFFTYIHVMNTVVKQPATSPAWC
jgi:NAD(P)-dependent dehydrogenase (short-subunit alcohol dehydrogenase family)